MAKKKIIMEDIYDNKNFGKRLKNDGWITVTDYSKLKYFILSESKQHLMFEITPKEFEKLYKKFKKQETYFKNLAKKKKNKALKDCFFVHFNPELSFFFTK